MITLQQTRTIAMAAAMALTMPAVHAQFISKDYKRSADQFYAKGDYYSAAQYYEKYLAGKAGGQAADYNPYQIKRGVTAKDKDNSSKAETLSRIAGSYYNLNDFTHAAQWYKLLLEADAAYPDAHYKYGVSLRANGQYAEAQREQEIYIKESNGGTYISEAKLELENCKFIQQAMSAGAAKVEVSKLNGNVNKEGASYAASWQDPETLVFTSTRSLDSGNKKPLYTNALFNATSLTGGFTEPKKLDIPELNNMQQGVACFDASGKTVFFTRWSVNKDGKKLSSIYKSEKSDTQWTKPVLLESTVNTEGSSSRQPFITADGKFLLFSSDRPGGMGGFDIWYAPLANGTAGEAVNFGKVINTKGDDEAPFYHAAGRELVFASNGRTGMGGYDLYVAKGDLAGSFEVPQNMGYPVNSIKDDIYFTSRGVNILDSALISSDRASLCCLELFAVNKIPEPVVKVEEPVAKAPETVEEVLKTPGNTYTTHFINFEFAKKDLTPGSDKYLDDVVAYLNAHPGARMEVAAYTDGIGGKEFNIRLSDDRAKVCVDYILSKGISKDRLTAKGYGDCCPIEAETTADGKDIPEAREKNRRVELKLL